MVTTDALSEKSIDPLVNWELPLGSGASQMRFWQPKVIPLESITSGAEGAPSSDVSMLYEIFVSLTSAYEINEGSGNESPLETNQPAVTLPRLLKIDVAYPATAFPLSGPSRV